jgi:hypothetical protein
METLMHRTHRDALLGVLAVDELVPPLPRQPPEEHAAPLQTRHRVRCLRAPGQGSQRRPEMEEDRVTLCRWMSSKTQHFNEILRPTAKRGESLPAEQLSAGGDRSGLGS